jgi:hypothetical protein
MIGLGPRTSRPWLLTCVPSGRSGHGGAGSGAARHGVCPIRGFNTAREVLRERAGNERSAVRIGSRAQEPIPHDRGCGVAESKPRLAAGLAREGATHAPGRGRLTLAQWGLVHREHGRLVQAACPCEGPWVAGKARAMACTTPCPIPGHRDRGARLRFGCEPHSISVTRG